jgi:hypothetical protein
MLWLTVSSPAFAEVRGTCVSTSNNDSQSGLTCGNARRRDAGGSLLRFAQGCAWGWGLCPNGGCAPMGSICCPSGYCPAGTQCCGTACCNPGSICSRFGCVPQGSIDCGSHWCNPGQQCASGNSCLPYGAVDCGDGRHCNEGFQCGSGSRCIPDGYTDCGNGRSCGPGLVCSGSNLCLSQEDIDQQQERERRAQQEAEERREQAERDRQTAREQENRDRTERQNRTLPSSEDDLLRFNMQECRKGDSSACSRALGSDSITDAQRNEVLQLLSPASAGDDAPKFAPGILPGGLDSGNWLLLAGLLIAGLALLGAVRLYRARQGDGATPDFEAAPRRQSSMLPGEGTHTRSAAPLPSPIAAPDAAPPENRDTDAANADRQQPRVSRPEAYAGGAALKETLPDLTQDTPHPPQQHVLKPEDRWGRKISQWSGLMSNSSEDTKRKQVKKYFAGKDNTLPWILIVIGVPLLFLKGIGLILIIIGLILMFSDNSTHNDKQIDRWTEEDFAAHDYKTRASQLAGFSELVREPILLRGLAGDVLKAGIYNGERVGDDGMLRATPFAVTVILCSPEQMGIYQTGIDLTTGNRVNETFLEVFYQDITAISVRARSETLDFNSSATDISTLKLNADDLRKGFSKRKLRAQLASLRGRFENYIVDGSLQRDMSKVYRIDLADGDQISIPIADERPTKAANAQNDAEAGDEAARNMVALRAFAREKKRALLHGGPAGSGALV